MSEPSDSKDQAKQEETSNPEEKWLSFRELLNSEYDWPSMYLFKFIVPRVGLQDVENLLSEAELTIRASKRGNYVSITARFDADSADAVIDVYKAAGGIPGVISL